MSRERLLKGWPPKAGKVQERGQGTTNEDAAVVLESLLAEDADRNSTMFCVLGQRRRWAIHFAIGALRRRP